MSSKTRVIQKTITDYFCDVCSTPVTSYSLCHICNKQLCGECLVFDDRDGGDYPTKYCQGCWGTGKEYRKKMLEIEEAADNKIIDLNEMWKAEARPKGKE